MSKPEKFTVYVDPRRKKAILRNYGPVDSPGIRRSRRRRRILLLIGIPFLVWSVWDQWAVEGRPGGALSLGLILGLGLLFFAWLDTGAVESAEAAAMGDRLEEQMTVEGKLLQYSYRRILEPPGTRNLVMIHLGAARVQRHGNDLIFTGGVTRKKLSTGKPESVDYPEQFTLTDYFLPPVAEVLEDREIPMESI